MDVVNSVKGGLAPNFLIKVTMALIILALVNGFLPAEYKISKLISGLFA